MCIRDRIEVPCGYIYHIVILFDFVLFKDSSELKVQLFYFILFNAMIILFNAIYSNEGSWV